MTQILSTKSSKFLSLAIDLLNQGQVIAIPTDTVYGVAALALDARASAQIYKVKARPPDKPLPVFVPSVAALDQVCQNIPDTAFSILEQHWPGALTVILPASPTLPSIVTNHGTTVGVRIPDHPLVIQLLTMLDAPLAVTSANLSGQPNTQTAAEVDAQLHGRLPLILDDGPTPGSIASTVLDLTVTPPRVLRQGAVKIKEVD